MAAGIAGASAPASTMDALGSATGGVTSPDASSLAPGAGADQDRAQTLAYMGELRDLDKQVQATFAKMPVLGPISQQWSTLFQKAVQAVAKTAVAQTGSASALPTAGQ